MKTKPGRYFTVIVVILIIQSCLKGEPLKQMEDLSKLYSDKKITNSQMLYEMGKVYLENNENQQVKYDYFNRLIISGYSTHVIHHYLLRQEEELQENDMKIVLFALNEGKHFKLADSFRKKFSAKFINQLNTMSEASDSLIYYDTLIKRIPRAEAYLNRSRFFSRMGATDMAGADAEIVMETDPCHEDAVFQQAITLFQQEKTKNVIALLESCNILHTEWHPVFYKLAFEIESVKNSANSIEEKLFKQANLYVNNGFADIALRKNNELLEMKGVDNPDYIALQAFIHYRLKNKALAEKYIKDAESLTGKKSRLGEMIAGMEQVQD